jgi:HSP20 family protein
MALRDLFPGNSSSRKVGVSANEVSNPFLALHREMNRMFTKHSAASTLVLSVRPP